MLMSVRSSKGNVWCREEGSLHQSSSTAAFELELLDDCCCLLFSSNHFLNFSVQVTGIVSFLEGNSFLCSNFVYFTI